MAQMTETKIILLAVPLVALAYWMCILRAKREFNLQELVVLVFDVVATITGSAIFVGAYRMADSSAEHAIWLAIGGVSIAFFFLEQVRVIFKRLLTCDSVQTVHQQSKELESENVNPKRNSASLR
jgi:hypothetical protein